MTSYRRTTVKCLQWTLWRLRSVIVQDVGRPTIFTSGRRAVPHVNQESCRMAQILCPALTGGLFFKGGQQGWRKRVSPSIDFPHLHLPESHASGGPGAAIDREATLVILPFSSRLPQWAAVCVTASLSALEGGVHVSITAGGVNVLTLKQIMLWIWFFFFNIMNWRCVKCTEAEMCRE